MSSEGVGKLCIVSRKINSEEYVDILEHYLMLSIKEAFGDSSDFLFQDYNASCDKSKQVKNFLNQNGHSHILKNIWNVWKRNIEKRRLTNMDELRLANRESWGEIPFTL